MWMLLHISSIARTLALEVQLRDGGCDRQRHAEVPPSEASADPRPTSCTGQPRDQTVDLAIRISIRTCPPSGDTVGGSGQSTVGFREAQFTDHGFELNVESRSCAPRPSSNLSVRRTACRRAQRSDAASAHISVQHRAHLALSASRISDACDEMGLLVSKRFPAGSISATSLGSNLHR